MLAYRLGRSASNTCYALLYIKPRYIGILDNWTISRAPLSFDTLSLWPRLLLTLCQLDAMMGRTACRSERRAFTCNMWMPYGSNCLSTVVQATLIVEGVRAIVLHCARVCEREREKGGVGGLKDNQHPIN